MRCASERLAMDSQAGVDLEQRGAGRDASFDSNLHAILRAASERAAMDGRAGVDLE